MPFDREPNALIWRGGHETVRIEPWGADSLRVRATQGAAIRSDLPGALGTMPPASSDAEIAIGPERASIRSGLIRADVTAEGQISFTNAATGATLLAEPAPRFIHPPARGFKPARGRSQPDHGGVPGGGGGTLLRPGPTPTRSVGSEGLRDRPLAPQHRGQHPVPGFQPRLRFPVAQPRGRPRRVGPQCHALGRRGQPPGRLLGHGGFLRRYHGCTTPTSPATRRCCRRGPPASGSASCATPARRSCWPSPASIAAAACRWM